jgi:uncharacterized protein YoxC
MIDYGSLTLQVLAGIAVLLIGIGAFLALLALSKTLTRLTKTLDIVDRQLEHLSVPIASTLTHVDSLTESTGRVVERVGGVTESLEKAAGRVSQTATLTRDALAPSIVNIGAVATGVTAGLRRLVTGKKTDGRL